MKNNQILMKKLFAYFVAAFFVAAFSFGIYSLVTGVISFGEYEGWDGYTVADSFQKGNGTQENPYIIQDAPEFMFFKNLIEGDEYLAYQDKYYALEADINFNGNTITPIGVQVGEEERIFKGHLDGNGKALLNFKISEPAVIGDVTYYSVFSKVEDASIHSIGVKDYEIRVKEDTENNVISPFIGSSSVVTEESLEKVSRFYKIYLSNFYIDSSLNNSNNNISGFIGMGEGNIQVKNISVIGEVNAPTDLEKEVLFAYTGSSYENVISGFNILNTNNELVKYEGITNLYLLKNGVFYSDNNEISSESVLALFNEEGNGDYYWDIKDGMVFLNEYEKIVDDIPDSSKNFSFSIQKSPEITLHATGKENGIVYINDLEADLNYYKGLNYTEVANGSWPSGNNSNKYVENSNLAKVYIAYRGKEINAGSTITGYVSNTDRYTDFVYYKYYPIENGQVKIPLIDNPYADRPTDRAFNGWVTDYTGAVVSLDVDTYTRYVTVPASTMINITMYASWTEATYGTSPTSSSFKSTGMVRVAPSRRPVFNNLPTLYERNSVTTSLFNNNISFPSGAVDEHGASLQGQRCSRQGNQNRTCYYYLVIDTSNVSQGQSYYQLLNGNMTSYTIPAPDSYVVNSFMNMGDSLAGYFKIRTVTGGGSRAGLYSNTGVLQTGNGNGTYYELIQDPNVVLSNDNWDQMYYFVTRDTNIWHRTSEYYDDISTSKPMTITGLDDGTLSTRCRLRISSDSIYAGADLRIEYCTIRSGSYSASTSSPSNSGSNTIFGQYHNLKIGRGITTYTSGGTTYYNASGVIGGYSGSTGSSGSPTRYTLIVESGYYNSISALSTTGNTNYNSENRGTEIYTDGLATYGCDFDRISSDNDNLEVYYNIAGTVGGLTYSKGESTSTLFLTQVVKSGTIGEASSNSASGIYVGGLSGGHIYSPARLIVEGGDIFNINGGPLIGTNMTSYNAIYIYVKGGDIDNIFGGAAQTQTYGNRIISVTGGQINGSVFGGSNGFDGTEGDGTVAGNTFIYIGGKATIGNTSLTSGWFNAEVGSVFGAGNGRNGYNNIGSVNNSRVLIDTNATVNGNVYGGGNFGILNAQSGSAIVDINVSGGNIKGSVYGGGNNNGVGSTTRAANVDIDITGGTIDKSVYGGSRTKGIVYGDATVTVSGTTTIKQDVYGGGEGGYTNQNNPGTYVRDNIVVEINNGTINGNVYGGSAYGTVNAVNETTNSSNKTTTVTVNNGTIKGSVFGGAKGSDSYTPKVIGDITVTVNGGSIGKVFGGFDASGMPKAGDVVYLKGGTIGNAFGGGNNASQTSTNIYLQGSTITGNLYGGSNLLGTVTTSHVTVTAGSVTDIYGGNNLDGTTATTNVSVTGGTVNGDIYGGGNEAASTTSNVTVSGVTVHDIYGGGKEAGLTTSNVTVNSGAHAGSIFGGSNVSGDVSTSNVHVTGSQATSVYGGNNQGGSTSNTNVDTTSSTITNVYGGGDNATSGVSHVVVNSGTITNIYGGGNEAGLTTSNVNIYGGTITSVFGGSNTSGDITTSNVTVGATNPSGTSNIQIGTLYGGNNLGGTTTSTNITATEGTITTIFGGGNQAGVGSTNLELSNITSTDIYGGGNEAGVVGNTYLDIDDSTVNGNIYGGGNEGVVEGNTQVFLTDTTVIKNAFAGGNGSTAIVYGNTTITIDGATEVGTATSEAPKEGCVFGGGNAANTGLSTNNNSTATVNLVGGKIHGNVYGGPKMAIVYGQTKTNIGTAAVNNNSLTEDDIVISGTVFGGGESNATGSETYDWTFISVTEGIDVVIDGTNYETHNHDFIINGSIFGSGNASSSAGQSTILIRHLGSVANPNKSISIQRANLLTIDSSVIELDGATDRTNDYSDILYSFNIIDKLVLKNNSRLLLQHNANLLKELYSGVDVNNTLVPATVDIDDENKTVTRNVDNRIYMTPGQNLNVTINQAATAYGRVTGMTFFGMYSAFEGGGYRYGLYDDDYDYGDSGNASLEIIGGSYVIGLHHDNHDITKDGFYSNYLDEETFTEIVTAYIDPTAIGETGYRWIIGFEAINYEFTLTASKYSSLGTYELQLIDFADGNTTFDVLGFDASGLNQDVDLVDSNLVPRVGRTVTEANTIYGLSMKAETQEWTGYGTTKMVDTDGGDFTGTQTYRTDSRSLPPSLMFYLYHAKNITFEGNLGTVILTLQAAIPKNQIEDDIKFITVTINLVARQYDDEDNYDASITYDRRYEMPSSTSVNITNQSQFTAYYSLISWNDHFENVYGNSNQNFHVLVTNNPLPVGTMITMLDVGARTDRPEYYYYKIDQAAYNAAVAELNQYHEITYRLSNFIKMGSTSNTNTYDDQDANQLYYDSVNGLVDEEFIFIFDFKECTSVTGDHLNNTMLFELRNHENRTVFTVLGIREGLMVYNTYESSNVVLSQTLTGVDSYLYYNVPDEFQYSTQIQYDETENKQSVIDTNYESSSMGMNIIFFDKDGEQVSSSLLLGTSFIIDNQEHFADGDGVFRIKLANKVSNLNRLASLTINTDLPAGTYTIRYVLFASDDGLHNSSVENSVSQEFNVTVVSAENSIMVDCDDEYKLVDGETGLNFKNTNINSYTVTYDAHLVNPNFRVEVLKRKTDSIDSTEFVSVPFSDLFTTNLTPVVGGNEMLISMDNQNEKTFDFELQDELTSGTYRVVFKLYDLNQLIDDDVKYVIVKKNIE